MCLFLAALVPAAAGCGYIVTAVGVGVAANDGGSGGNVAIQATGDARVEGARSFSATVPIAVTLAAGTTSLRAEVVAPLSVAATLVGVTGPPGVTLSATRGEVTGIDPGAEVALTLRWDSQADLGGPARDVVFQVTPFGAAGPGRPARTPRPFAVGDSPPRAQLVSPTPTALVRGDQSILVRLFDEERDAADVDLEVEIDGQRAPLSLAGAATLVGLPAAPLADGGVLLTASWNSLQQVPGSGQVRVLATIRPGVAAAPPAASTLEVGVLVDNTDPAGDAVVGAPLRSRDPDVPVVVTVSAGTTELVLEFVTATAARATVSGVVGGVLSERGRVTGITAATETAIALVWESGADLGRPRVGVRFRATPIASGIVGRPTDSAPLTVGDSPPIVQVLSPTPTAAVSRNVDVLLSLIDAEGDPVDLSIDVATDGGRAPIALDPPIPLAGFATASSGTGGRLLSLVWASAAQVESAGRARLIVSPDDGNAATVETSVEVTVDVDNTGGTGDALLSAPARSRSPDVPIDVVIAAGTTEVRTFFVTGTAAQASIRSPTLGTVGAGGRIVGLSVTTETALSFVWESQADLGGPRAGVRFEVQPVSPAGVGRRTTSPPLTVGDSAPALTILAPTAGAVVSGAVALQVRVTDEEGDPVDLALEVELDGGARLPLIETPPAPGSNLPTAPVASGGLIAGFIWGSGVQAQGAGSARIVVTPSDGSLATSEAPASVTVLYDNSTALGDARLSVPSRSRSPDVPVVVTVAAGTSALQAAYVTATARPATIKAILGASAGAAQGSLVLSPTPTAEAVVSFLWDSQADLGGPRTGVLFEVTPSAPGILGRATTSGPLAVGDSAPLVQVVSPTPSAAVSGSTALQLRLIDAEGDDVSLAIEVEAGGTRTALVQAAPAQGLLGLATAPAPAGRLVSLVWETPAHVSATGAARVLVTPDDGSAATSEGAVEVTVDVDNTVAVLDARISAPARSRSPDVPVAVSVAAGTTELIVEYVAGDGPRPASLTSITGGAAGPPGRIVGISAPVESLVTFVWRSAPDLGGPRSGVALQVTPLGAAGRGRTSAAAPLSVGDTAPIAVLLAPAGSAQVAGNVSLQLALFDPEGDPVDVALAVSLDGGAAVPLALSVAGSVTGAATGPAPAGALLQVVWDSIAQAPATASARIIAALDDGNPATLEAPVEVTVRVDNRLSEGEVDVTAPARSRSPDVPVTVTVPAGVDELFIEVVTATARRATISDVVGGALALGEEGRIQGIGAAVETTITFTWRSGTDLGGPGTVAALRATPYFGAADRLGAPGQAGPLVVGDTAPTVTFTQPTGGAVSGNVVLGLRLVDPESDPVDVRLTFTRPGAATASALVFALPPSLTGLPTAPGDAGSGGRIVTAVWASRAQIVGEVPGVTLTAFLDDGSDATAETPASVTLTVGENEPPLIAIGDVSTVVDVHGRIAFELILSDPESDPAEIVLQWRRSSEAFPALPAAMADPDARRALLADPAIRSALRIMTEAPPVVRAGVRADGLTAASFRAPELLLASPADRLPGVAVELLRREPEVRTVSASGASVVGLAYTAGGASALVLREDGALQRVSVATGALEATITTFAETPSGLSLSPDGGEALVTIEGSTAEVRRVDLASGAHAVVPDLVDPQLAAFGPGGAAIAVADASDPGDLFYHVIVAPSGSAQRRVLLTVRDLEDVDAMAALPSGEVLVQVSDVALSAGRLLRLALDGAGAPRDLGSHEATALAVEADGGAALLLDRPVFGRRALRRVDLRTGRARDVFVFDGVPLSCVAARPDGRAALIGTGSGALLEVTFAGTALEAITITAVGPGPLVTLARAPTTTALAGGLPYAAALRAQGRLLASSPAGLRHRLVWDSREDLGPAASASIFVRATPFSRGRGGTAGASASAKPVKNDAVESTLARFTADTAAITVRQFAVAAGDLDGDGRDEAVVSVFRRPSAGVNEALEVYTRRGLYGSDDFGNSVPGEGFFERLSARAVGVPAGGSSVDDRAVAIGDVVESPGGDPVRPDVLVLATVTGGALPGSAVLRVHEQTTALTLAATSIDTLLARPVGAARVVGLDLGDLDGDGALDALATVRLDGTTVTAITALYGDGAGDFVQVLVEEAGVGLGFEFAAARIGDVDGDGLLDVVALTHDRPARHEVYFGRPGRTFEKGASPLPASPSTAFAVGDLLGLGRAQVVLRGTTGPGAAVVRVVAATAALGGAATTFAPVAGAEYTPGFAASTIGLTDVDGDGRRDIVIAGDPGAVFLQVAYQRAPGTFRAAEPQRVDASGGGLPQAMLGLDVDGDGAREVVLLQPGGPTAATPARYHALPFVRPGSLAAREMITTEVTQGSSRGAGSGSAGLAIGDATGDGRADVFATGPPFSPNGFAQQSTGELFAHPDGPFGPDVPIAVAIGDLYGDARSEVVFADIYTDEGGTGGLMVLEQDDIGITTGVTAFGVKFNAIGLAIGDVTGDGRGDIVVMTVSSGPTDFSGVFGAKLAVVDALDLAGATAPPIVLSASGNDLYKDVDLVDMDGDGRLDVVALVEDQFFGVTTVRIFAGRDAAGAVTTTGRVTIIVDDFVQCMAIADFTGDGRPDVALGSLNPANLIDIHDVAMLVQNGTGGALTFAKRFGVATLMETNSLEAADIDGDGRADLVILGAPRSNESRLLWARQDRGGVLQPAAQFAVPPFGIGFLAATGDLNGDGVPEVAPVGPGADPGIGIFEGR